MMMNLPLGLFALSLVFSILLAVHVVRTGREMYWLMIILMFQPVGGVVYAIIHVLPDIFGGSTARNLTRAARESLDPTREYREARTACEDTPTVRNQSRLAAAAVELGKFDEAEALNAQAAQGIHADDPALLLGRAKALLELRRPADALDVLARLGEKSDARTPPTDLALGRAYEALGRTAEAEVAYKWGAQRMPGFEGLARHAAFMARNDRKNEAPDALAEIDKLLAKLKGHFQKEARHWRDLAARALSEG